MRYLPVLLVLTLAVTALAKIEAGGEGQIFAGKYRVKAPQGWLYDDETLRETGCQLAIYPRGTKESDTPVKIFVGGGVLGEKESLDERIAASKDSLHFDSPSTPIEDLADLRTEQGVTARVVGFGTMRKSGFAGRFAYVLFPPRGLVEVELWARPDRLEQAVPAFEYVVASVRPE